MVLHPETVEAAVESGMIAANIGVESGNSTILGSVHKPSSVDHCRKVGEMMKRYPQVYVRAFIIIGFPHETLGMMLDTINLCREMDFDWNAIQKLTPLPSTEIYDQMVDEGFIEKDSLNTNSGYSLFSVREGEKQRKREEEGRLDSSSFYDYFSSNLNHVPTLEELDDIWLLMDYKVNYEKILFQTDEKKLKKMQRFLTSVVTRMTVNNPLASLFLGVVEHKLGNVEKARYHARVSKGYLDSSDYWQKSFSVFGVDHIYSELLD